MSIIEVENLYKNFKIYSDKGKTLKERILFKKRRNFEMREVLKGLSFSIEKGEAVGLIGHNGCGKSTLLKILTRILYPNEGEVRIKGRVSSLLELGAGFHPDLTGLENIYANAAVFGLKKKEIDKRLNDIINFSELGKFIDNPVRTYSSGMYMRLAFAVAINVDADVLLIDEILAVGDSNFQQKCYQKMRELRDSGITIVLVTHALETVEMFCTRAMWLNDGKIQIDGSPADAVKGYLDYMTHQQFLNAQSAEINEISEKVESGEMTRAQADEELRKREKKFKHNLEFQEKARKGSKEVLVRDAYWVNKEGDVTDTILAGESVTFEIDYEISKAQVGYEFLMEIYSDTKDLVFSASTVDMCGIMEDIPKSGWVKLQIKEMNLLRGLYFIKIGIFSQNREALDVYDNFKTFRVEVIPETDEIASMDYYWETATENAK